jgi:excisionase family DNA binding protein
LDPEYLQLGPAAQLVSLSIPTLRRAIASGSLPARVATLVPGSRTRRLLIRRSDLLEWVERAFEPARTIAAEAEEIVRGAQHRNSVRD